MFTYIFLQELFLSLGNNWPAENFLQENHYLGKLPQNIASENLPPDSVLKVYEKVEPTKFFSFIIIYLQIQNFKKTVTQYRNTVQTLL